MLLNDFFRIKTLNAEGGSYRAVLELNARHRIFEGHFPGQPVVPGVCLMQMVKEVAEVVMEMSRLRLVSSDQMKFIAMVVPGGAGELEMKLDCKRVEDGAMKVVASLLEDGKVCFKFSGIFKNE